MNYRFNTSPVDKNDDVDYSSGQRKALRMASGLVTCGIFPCTPALCLTRGGVWDVHYGCVTPSLNEFDGINGAFVDPRNSLDHATYLAKTGSCVFNSSSTPIVPSLFSTYPNHVDWNSNGSLQYVAFVDFWKNCDKYRPGDVTMAIRDFDDWLRVSDFGLSIGTGLYVKNNNEAFPCDSFVLCPSGYTNCDSGICRPLPAPIPPPPERDAVFRKVSCD